ncbi:hypothetical protein OPT61_g672 [Boeremia exigua]|uniref:Uncharacterized protein n=1 Tax=Boeremia exigua TaxID=749465 RepID=A0ACC2ITF3_9PLEO|nr:hypothetical protein OPT61_g672 [Boeremia exigua]
MKTPSKDVRTQKPSGPHLKINMPKAEAPSKVTKRSSKPRLKINLPKRPQKEEQLTPSVQETTTSDGTMSGRASPSPARTLSPVNTDSESEKEVHEEDEIYNAAWILYRMAHSKQGWGGKNERK